MSHNEEPTSETPPFNVLHNEIITVKKAYLYPISENYIDFLAILNLWKILKTKKPNHCYG